MIIGLDFGASSIKCSNYNDKFKFPEVFNITDSIDCGDTIPSVIWYKPFENSNGMEIVVGIGAENSVMLDDKNIIQNPKFYLKEENWSKYIPSLQCDVTSAKAIQDIFEYIKKCIDWKTNCEDNSVVLTMPVIFSEVQKNAIKQSALSAGLNVIDVIPEPVSAIFSDTSLFDTTPKTELIFTFDFGASTLDLSLVMLKNDGNNNISVDTLSTMGLNYGGINITNDIIDYMANGNFEYSESIKEALNDAIGYSSLVNTIEHLKCSKQLFRERNNYTTSWVWNYNGNSFSLKLSKDDLDTIFTKNRLYERILFTFNELFESTKDTFMQYYDDYYDDGDNVDFDSIDCILQKVSKIKLVGGSSQMKCFQSLVKDYFNQHNRDVSSMVDDNNDNKSIFWSVSFGAVNYYKLSQSDSINFEFKNRISYYICAIDKHSPPNIKTVINKNLIFPCFTANNNFPYVEGDKVKLYQTFVNPKGMDINSDGVIYLGYFQSDNFNDNSLYNLEVKKDGSIVATFQNDENSIENVETLDLNIGSMSVASIS